jgi:polyisoprenoid-binding protein YceI
MNRLPLLVLPLLVLAAGSAPAAVETYQIDPVHSSVGFRIRHIVTPVPGTFAEFTGTIVVDRDDLERSHVTASIDTNSIDTANGRRDDDLRSDKYFAVATFPTITFESTSWKKTGEDTYDVTGNLTMKDVTKAVTLHVKSLGFADAGRRYVSGWEATTTLDRRAWNITSGAPMIGDDVAITITIEAVRQQ